LLYIPYIKDEAWEVNWCNTVLRLLMRAGLLIYLNVFPGAHSLYGKFGFVDENHFGVDLNEHDVKFRGFRIYR
jgi:hypothetical protein